MFTGFIMFTEQADFCSSIFVLLISHFDVRKPNEFVINNQRLVMMPNCIHHTAVFLYTFKSHFTIKVMFYL